MIIEYFLLFTGKQFYESLRSQFFKFKYKYFHVSLLHLNQDRQRFYNQKFNIIRFSRK